MLTLCHLFTNVTKSVSIVTSSELGTSNNTTIYYTEQAEIKRTKQPYTTKGVWGLDRFLVTGDNRFLFFGLGPVFLCQSIFLPIGKNIVSSP